MVVDSENKSKKGPIGAEHQGLQESRVNLEVILEGVKSNLCYPRPTPITSGDIHEAHVGHPHCDHAVPVLRWHYRGKGLI